MSDSSTIQGDLEIAVARPARAYARLEPAMLALLAEALQPIHANIPYAVTSALGAVPDIMALRPRMVKELPSLRMEMIDGFEESALALGHADTIHTVSTRTPEEVPLLVERASRKCVLFRSDLGALALRDIIDGAPLEQLKGGPGHRNIAFDLFALAHIARTNWPAIQGKTALTPAEISEAEQDADQLATALGLRQQSGTASAPSAEMRLRAFNLFLLYRGEVERAVLFFFGKRASDILPAINTPRGPAKKAVEEEPEAPANTGVHPAVRVGEQADAQGEDEGEPADVGLPGASPYLKAK